MHANYVFHFLTDDLEGAEQVFRRWMETNGDSNNWYEPLLIMNSKDERKLLAQEDDWRGRDDLAVRLLGDTPSIKGLKELAWEIVATDFFSKGGFGLNYEDKPDNFKETMKELDLETWPDFFFDHAVKQVRKDYLKLTKEDILGDNSNLAHYHRRNRIIVFERIIQSLSYYPPFSELGNPYNYRAFELYGEDDGESCLVADIHT